MLLHGKNIVTDLSGPGKRAVIWFQGTTVPILGEPYPEASHFSVASLVMNDEVMQWLSLQTDIEGVTFRGGEPMQQVADLLDLIGYVKDVRPELSMGLFTAYTEMALATGHWTSLTPKGTMADGDGKVWLDIASKIDFAVMGRYDTSKVTTDKPLCFSTNQDVVLFSERYKAPHFKARSPEITIGETGHIIIEGYPGLESYKVYNPEA